MNDGIAILSNSGSAVVGFLINYLIEKRKEDKQVQEAAQEIVWRENEKLKENYRLDIASLRAEVAALHEDSLATEKVAEAARTDAQRYQLETFEAKTAQRQAEAELKYITGECDRLKEDNRLLRVRLAGNDTTTPQ